MSGYHRTVVISLLVVMAAVAMFSGTTAASTHDYCTEQESPTVLGNGSYENLQTQYCDAAGELDNTTEELNETITALEEGNGDLESANETLTTIENQHETLKQRESAVVSQLVEETATGKVAGGFGAMQALGDDSEQRTESVATTANSYQTTLETHRSGPQQTVRLSLFGSLAGGVIVGLLVGAAVPMIAARRIEDKMKLSRDVSYDKKIVVLPAVIGVVLAVAGAVVLYQFVGIGDLIVVIR